jgi:hypothetical protein
MLPHRPCHHSATSFLSVCISCHVNTVFVFRNPYLSIKLYRIYVYYTNHVIYSVRYYLQFHVTVVGLGTYCSWIWRHYCTLKVCSVCTCNRCMFFEVICWGMPFHWVRNEPFTYNNKNIKHGTTYCKFILSQVDKKSQLYIEWRSPVCYCTQ